MYLLHKIALVQSQRNTTVHPSITRAMKEGREEEDEEKIFAVIPDCSPFWLDPVYCLRL